MTENDDHHDTLLRHAHHDDGCLGELLESYRNYLDVLARLQVDRNLDRKVPPSDVVQETLVHARESFAGFRGASQRELAVWLRRILVQRLARMVRHHTAGKRDYRLEQQLELDVDNSSRCLARQLVSPKTSPSQAAAKREYAVQLADALAGLKSEYREVLLLRHVEELSFPEVSQRMGRSLDSVKNLWARAVEKLRAGLGELL